MVPLLLPWAPTGLASIAARGGRGTPPQGQLWSLACTLPHVRDGLRVRCRARWCPCGRSSGGRPAHRAFLRHALLDVTTIVPTTYS
jgi:hypothetical protein